MSDNDIVHIILSIPVFLQPSTYALTISAHTRGEVRDNKGCTVRDVSQELWCFRDLASQEGNYTGTHQNIES